MSAAVDQIILEPGSVTQCEVCKKTVRHKADALVLQIVHLHVVTTDGGVAYAAPSAAMRLCGEVVYGDDNSLLHLCSDFPNFTGEINFSIEHPNAICYGGCDGKRVP